ncbi:MAG: VOC family protein [Hyphomicrobiaceae bacterium]|nr:VOC family protein [Hyphomicrobiaceae bacterium]
MPSTARKRAPKTQSAAPSASAPWRHGHFHWNELRTRNVETVKAFYAACIGWTFQRTATPEGQDYWLAMEGGVPVAGLFQLTSPRFDAVPESWIPFLAVDDVDTRVAKAVTAGATLMMPAFNVPGVGRIAMLMEPGGAGIGWITPVSDTAKG